MGKKKKWMISRKVDAFNYRGDISTVGKPEAPNHPMHVVVKV